MRKLILLIIIVFSVSAAVAHSGEQHSNQTVEDSYQEQSKDMFSQLSANYPPSVIILVSVELLLGIILAIIALWHYRKKGK